MKENKPKGRNPEEDPEIDPESIDTASERPAEPTPPEVSPGLEELTEWDTPTDAAGETVPKVQPDDETAAAEELVEEGVEEADRDQRLAAEDPDYEG